MKFDNEDLVEIAEDCIKSLKLAKSELEGVEEYVLIYKNIEDDIEVLRQLQYPYKEKGEASDSFKRAGFNWGIGRELYTAPFIWIKSENCKIYDTGRLDKYNKPIYGCNDNFEVKSIEIKDKKIISLEITLKNKVVFSTKISNATGNQNKTEIEEIDINAKIGFGKYKDLTWLELYSQNPNYFDWLIENAKSPEGAETYKKIREEIEKSFINIEGE